jgi:hypothetical protein
MFAPPDALGLLGSLRPSVRACALIELACFLSLPPSLAAHMRAWFTLCRQSMYVLVLPDGVWACLQATKATYGPTRPRAFRHVCHHRQRPGRHTCTKGAVWRCMAAPAGYDDHSGRARLLLGPDTYFIPGCISIQLARLDQTALYPLGSMASGLTPSQEPYHCLLSTRASLAWVSPPGSRPPARSGHERNHGLFVAR